MKNIKTSNIADLLNLELAWERVRFDYSNDRVFVEHPYERQLIERDLEGWMGNVRNKLLEDNYYVMPMQICDSPKFGDTIRPGGMLYSHDHLLYVALVGAVLENIQKTLSPFQGVIDYSYPLSEDLTKAKWINYYRDQFQNWNNDSITKLNQDDINFMVQTDISAYYEYIDLRTLHSDLNETGANEAITTTLVECLREWSQVKLSSRGLPQGYYASDILAKLYLNQIDNRLRNKNINHFRYVDDYRIFCSSKPEARKVIQILSRLLRDRGLTLSSVKTEIFSAESAIQKINDTTQLIEEVTIDLGNFHSFYFHGYVYIEANEDETPSVEVLRQAYLDHFYSDSTNGGKFNKSLFRYLLKCFKKHKDFFKPVIQHCLDYLKLYPSETEYIVAYLREVGGLNRHFIQARFSIYLMSVNAVYDYQIYQIYNSFLNSDFKCKVSRLVEYARTVAFDRNKPAYLRAVCKRFLGDFGENSDLEDIRDSYSPELSELEQCEIILGIQRMEKSKRNHFYGSLNNQNLLIGRAIKLAKDM